MDESHAGGDGVAQEERDMGYCSNTTGKKQSHWLQVGIQEEVDSIKKRCRKSSRLV